RGAREASHARPAPSARPGPHVGARRGIVAAPGPPPLLGVPRREPGASWRPMPARLPQRPEHLGEPDRPEDDAEDEDRQGHAGQRAAPAEELRQHEDDQADADDRRAEPAALPQATPGRRDERIARLSDHGPPSSLAPIYAGRGGEVTDHARGRPVAPGRTPAATR